MQKCYSIIQIYVFCSHVLQSPVDTRTFAISYHYRRLRASTMRGTWSSLVPNTKLNVCIDKCLCLSKQTEDVFRRKIFSYGLPIILIFICVKECPEPFLPRDITTATTSRRKRRGATHSEFKLVLWRQIKKPLGQIIYGIIYKIKQMK